MNRVCGWCGDTTSGHYSTNISAVNPDPTKYALFAVACHEMDEVLGMDTAMNSLTNGAPTPTGAVSPMDLYRYDGVGARSLSTVSNLASYFSLDGTTDLARFNQYQGGDYQDFYSYYGGQTPEVQDAFATQGASPVPAVELRVLDVLGYTRASAFVVKTNQTITFNPLPAKALGEPAFAVTATASSGLPVSFSIVSGPATISTATITLTNTGTVTVQASQAGNTNYNAAPSTNQSFVVYTRPGIGQARAGTNIVISWYTNVAGFGLYSSTNLNSNSWQVVNPAPVIVNGQYVVSNGISGAAKFYRLMK